MIHTSKQLKDKVRNISKGDSDVAKILIRTFMMERFLERVSLSKYRNNFILKGGMLVASIIGVDMRATMDIDATVRALPLNEEDVERIVSEICDISIEDGVCFRIVSITKIMEEFDYPGIRIMLEATLDRMRQPIKLDVSTDDAITPDAVEYEYKLMFEDRTISLLSYNIETLLAEKIQTILARGIANTRMRDFYDVYEIVKFREKKIDKIILFDAFGATCNKRETIYTTEEMMDILAKINTNEAMVQMWKKFRKKNYFVDDLEWDVVLKEAKRVIEKYLSSPTNILYKKIHTTKS